MYIYIYIYIHIYTNIYTNICKKSSTIMPLLLVQLIKVM